MKKLIKFNILFMILIVINTSEIICQTCGSTVYCPPGIKYPYYICDFNSTEAKMPVICAEDPYNIPGFQGYGKDYSIRRISLPICFDIDLTTIPDEVGMPLGNVVFSKNKAIDEINRAAFSWNCICGKENEPCSCSIKVMFSDLEEDFQFDGELAYAKTRATFPFCNLKCGDSFIMFNNTTSFRKDVSGNVNRFFINDDFITTSTISKVYSDGYSKVYNFFDVMLHEAGHILGFDHYDDSTEPPYIGCYPPIEGVMSSKSNPAKTKSIYPNQYDKCMFAKLYCPSLTPVEESDIVEEEIYKYPNPAEDYIVISMTNILGNENVFVYSTFGQKYIVNFINTNDGLKIDVSNLSPGVYFIKIGDKVEKFVKY